MATNIISARRQESKRDSAPRAKLTPKELDLCMQMVDMLQKPEMKKLAISEVRKIVAKAFDVPVRRLQGILAA